MFSVFRNRPSYWFFQRKVLDALTRIEAIGVQQMAAIDDLNTAIADLKTEVGEIGTRMDTLMANLTAAQAGGDDAAIQAATAAIQQSVNDLKTVAATTRRRRSY